MEFLTSHEFLISLIIEAGMLLLIATGIIVYLLRRLKQLSNQPPPPQTDTLQTYLRSELEKTREKQAKLGNNSQEAKQLRAACDLRCQVLEGEIRVQESADADENHYWRPVLDYYEGINKNFADQTKALEDRLATSVQRINNLEKFKEKLFDLRDRLNHSYENNNRLEKELREKIKQGAKLSELEHTLSQIEREKEGLQKELQLAEHEFMVIMENAAAGATNVQELNIDVSAANHAASQIKELTARLKEVEEENEFLCQQIQALLAEEIGHKKKSQTKDHEYLALEKRYAKMEERYLELQEELDKRP